MTADQASCVRRDAILVIATLGATLGFLRYWHSMTKNLPGNGAHWVATIRIFWRRDQLWRRLRSHRFDGVDQIIRRMGCSGKSKQWDIFIMKVAEVVRGYTSFLE